MNFIKQHSTLFKRLILVCVLILVALVLLEGLLRVCAPIISARISVRTLEASLDSYEMIDPKNSRNWILRPGYQVTLSELAEEKQQEGKELGAAIISRFGQKYNLSRDDVLFQINEFGFKGPDIDKAKEPGSIRIMTIGDSCTFGLFYDWSSYARTLERYLQNQGNQVEVVNAGVEGYSTQNVLYRLDYFISFQPDIAIIYLGWNDLYADCLGIKRLYIFRGFYYLYNSFFPPNQLIKDGKLCFADHYYNSSTAEARRYNSDYEPSFLPQVQQILSQLSENGVKPVLVTLPGLFSIDNAPSKEALQMGHLPSNIKNAYVLALMTRKYNNSLKQLAAEENIPLIDLEEWAENALVPPESWFFDSVHLSPEGQIAIGDYIGECLISLGLVK